MTKKMSKLSPAVVWMLVSPNSQWNSPNEILIPKVTELGVDQVKRAEPSQIGFYLPLQRKPKISHCFCPVKATQKPDIRICWCLFQFPDSTTVRISCDICYSVYFLQQLQLRLTPHYSTKFLFSLLFSFFSPGDLSQWWFTELHPSPFYIFWYGLTKLLKLMFRTQSTK